MPALSRDHIWVWDGPVNNLGPSIYGLGETARFFHAENISCMWLSSKTITETALDKLKGFKQVVWELARSTWRRKTFTVAGEEAERVGFLMEDSWSEGRGWESAKEAEKISKLSRTYTNLAGGILDYSFGGFDSRGGTPDHLKEIYGALKKHNPALQLFWMIYTKDLDPKWADYLPYLDVLNLWEPDPKNLSNLDATIDRCAQVFPGKPILLGLYLVNYWGRRLAPGDEDELQWHHEWAIRPLAEEVMELHLRKAVEYVEAEKIIGFSILGESLLDKFPETANWVRQYLARNLPLS